MACRGQCGSRLRALFGLVGGQCAAADESRTQGHHGVDQPPERWRAHHTSVRFDLDRRSRLGCHRLRPEALLVLCVPSERDPVVCGRLWRGRAWTTTRWVLRLHAEPGCRRPVSDSLPALPGAARPTSVGRNSQCADRRGACRSRNQARRGSFSGPPRASLRFATRSPLGGRAGRLPGYRRSGLVPQDRRTLARVSFLAQTISATRSRPLSGLMRRIRRSPVWGIAGGDGRSGHTSRIGRQSRDIEGAVLVFSCLPVWCPRCSIE